MNQCAASSKKFAGAIIALVLCMAAALPYAQVRNFGYVDYDDDLYVGDNSYVKAGLSLKTAAWAFTSTSQSNWHPLTWLSYMLDRTLVDATPATYHLSNVAYHLLNTMLLFFLLRAMTGALWKSAFVAALFGLHPLHVESVAWISERKDVLSALFWICTMACYLRYVKRRTVSRYCAVVVCFSLGLMAKPMTVTLPFALLLLDLWPLRRVAIFPSDTMDPAQPKARSRRLTGPGAHRHTDSQMPAARASLQGILLEKVPLLALSIASSFVTFVVQRHGGAMPYSDRLPFVIRAGNAVMAYVAYLKRMVVPTDLAVLYPYPRDMAWGLVILFALLLLAFTWVSIAIVRRAPYVLVGWLWFAGTLVPVIGLVQIGIQSMADRYTYIPSIGLFIAVSWGVPELLKKVPLKRVVCSALASAVLLALMVCARKQVSYWSNSVRLFSHTIAVTANNYGAYNGLGSALGDLGRSDEAIRAYSEAVRINPDYTQAHNNLGVALMNLGRFEEAIFHYQEALRVYPNYLYAHNNLGVALMNLGRFEEAAFHFSEALRIDPELHHARKDLETARRRMASQKQHSYEPEHSGP